MKTALPAVLSSLLDAANPPELRRGPRANVAAVETIEAAVADAHAQGVVAAADRPRLLAVLLLWHDHWEAAHELVQEDPSPMAAWIHAVIHRREPDYWNAKYWVHRARCPDVGALLAERLADFITKTGKRTPVELLGRAGWEGARMVDACEQCAAADSASAEARFLREVQRLELLALVEVLAKRN